MQFHFLDNTLSISVIFISCYTLRGSCILILMGNLVGPFLKIEREGDLGAVETLLVTRLLKKGDLISIDLLQGMKMQTRKYCGVSLKNKSTLLSNG